MANDMVPTNTPDYSSYILKVRQATPDFVPHQSRGHRRDHLPQAVPPEVLSDEAYLRRVLDAGLAERLREKRFAR